MCVSTHELQVYVSVGPSRDPCDSGDTLLPAETEAVYSDRYDLHQSTAAGRLLTGLYDFYDGTGGTGDTHLPHRYVYLPVTGECG